MDAHGVEELVVLHLWDAPSDGGWRGTQAAAVAELAEALGLSETMADRLTLLSAISSLEGSGLVAESTARLDDPAGERNVYSLTAAGRKRALELYEGMRDERVTVHGDDGRTEHRLVEAADAVDCSLASLLARRSPDGDLYLDEPVETRFVDREAELAELEAAFEESLDGRPRTALVTGEAGVGATTLVEAFLDRVRERDVDASVAVGRCTPEERQPYGAVREALEALGGDADADAGAGLGRAASRADADDAEMYEAQRAALFSQVTAWVAERARETPTVLVIEDLQWADAATIDLLAHVAAESYHAPLLLVGTSRTATGEAEHPLGERLDERTTDERVLALALAPFDRAATAELVEVELGQRGVPAAFVDAVYEATGGNPLFVVEMLSQQREEGTLDQRIDRYPESIETASLPRTVETTIERRLERLDGPTRATLAAGAVAGDPIPIPILERCCGLTGSVLGERIDLLVDGGVWERNGDAIRFRSDVVRSVVLENLDDELRRRFHLETATYRLETGTGESAEIATHFERAGEPERALEHYRRAADEATEVYAHDVAAEHAERALELARDLDCEETALDLLEALGDVYYTRGEYAEADKHFRYVRERTDDPERIRRSYHYQARMAFERSAYDEAEAHARRGLEVGGDEVTEEVCWLTDYLGGAYFGRGHFEEAITHHETLRERAASIDFTLALGRAHQNLGDCYAGLGAVPRAVDFLERGVELMEAAGDERELAICLHDLGITYKRFGDFDAAVETLERCAELAERTGNVTASRLANVSLALVAQQRGDLETARERYAESRSIARRIGDPVAEALALSGESLVELAVGHVDDAIDGLERALEMASVSEANQQIAQFEWVLGKAYFLVDDVERAYDSLERSLERSTEHGFRQQAGACKSVLGVVECEHGNVETAIAHQREGLELVEEDDDPIIWPIRAYRLARTLLRDGATDEALELAREAHETRPDVNVQYGVKIDATYGAAQLAAGDREGARETLEATLTRARNLSNEATIVALRELGRLEALEGDPAAARERLEDGRRTAERAGFRAYLPHFDELLANLDGVSAPSTSGDAD